MTYAGSPILTDNVGSPIHWRPSSIEFEKRRRRSQDLRERYPFAAEMLTLYGALVDVHETAFEEASALWRDSREAPSAQAVCVFAAERVMPRVIDITVAHGPQALAAAVSERWARANLIELAASWMMLHTDNVGLPIDRQPSVQTYLARASLQPVLECLAHISGPQIPIALSGAGSSWPKATRPDEHRCPACGGPPQLAYFDVSNEDLVSGRRHLLCARCSTGWPVLRMQCASCLEESSSKLLIFAERETYPHMRADACERCKRYLLTINLAKDDRAVPLVDELAGLPLDLYAQERGFTKLIPNLMGN